MESPENPELVPESAEPMTMWPEYCNPSYVMPEIIEVKVAVGDDHYFFPVTVVKANADSKSYLGGYRHKANGKVYHHASSQTPTQQQKHTRDYSNLRARETQTVELKTKSIQGNRESGTQMERIDLRINNARDVIKYAKPYITAEEVILERKKSAITMQRYWRGCMARTRANDVRQRNIDFKVEQIEKQRDTAIQEEERRVRDQLRRTHPKSNADFAVLYNELDQWRRSEVAKIKSMAADSEERRKAMADLLANETKALQSLQLLKASAQKEMHYERTEEMLQHMAEPLQWQLSHGDTAYVQTADTQRAKQLLDLFHALQLPLQHNDQRLDTLLKVKWTIGEVDNELTYEIRELIDREADLLSRNRPVKSMERLRMRLNNLFLQFVQSPDFNPRAGDFLKETKVTNK